MIGQGEGECHKRVGGGAGATHNHLNLLEVENSENGYRVHPTFVFPKSFGVFAQIPYFIVSVVDLPVRAEEHPVAVVSTPGASLDGVPGKHHLIERGDAEVLRSVEWYQCPQHVSGAV